MDRKSNRSLAWKYFVKKDDTFATCMICSNEYSFRTSVSNLRKHLVKKHGKCLKMESYNSDDEFNESVTREQKFSSSRYFDLNEDNLANCKLCYKDVSHESVADLIKHIVENHGDFDDGTDNESGTGEAKTQNKSMIWFNFKPCPDTQIATCLICKLKVSYQNGMSSLKKHLENEHPKNNYDGEDSKSILISADGELYEIETTPSKNNGSTTVQKDPIHLDTVYLDDFDDYKISPKRSISRRPSFKRKRWENVIPNKKIRPTLNSSSEEDRPSMRKKEKFVKKDRIDLFGEYLTSLLKELPRTLSDELQGNMIQQVITAKVNYDREAVNKVTEIAVSESVPAVNQSNSEVNGVEN